MTNLPQSNKHDHKFCKMKKNCSGRGDHMKLKTKKDVYVVFDHDGKRQFKS